MFCFIWALNAQGVYTVSYYRNTLRTFFCLHENIFVKLYFQVFENSQYVYLKKLIVYK